MDRRHFNQFLLSSAAAASMIPPQFAGAQQSPPAKSTGTLASGDAKIVVTITSKFMEDLSDQTPYVLSQNQEAAFVAADGTLNIYNPIWFNVPGMTATVDRIFSSPEGLTGWAMESRVAPPDLRNGPVRLPPTALIVRGSTDTLLLYRNFSIQYAAIRTDGALDANIRLQPSSACIPLVSGELPNGTRYIPEMDVEASGQISGIVLRDAMNLGRIYSVDGAAFPSQKGWLFGARRTLCPFQTGREGVYRFVALEETGDVVAITLAISGDGMAHLTERKSFGNFPKGAITLLESKPGVPELIIAEPPRLTTIKGSYDPAGTAPASWSTPAVVQIPECRTFPDDTTFEAKAAFDPNLGITDLFLIAASQGITASPEIWISSRGSDNAWQPIMLIESAHRFVGSFAAEPRSFITFNAKTGFEYWHHDDTGELTRNLIKFEGDNAKIVSSASYRVGVNLSWSGQPLGAEAVGVRASSHCVAVSNAKHSVLSPKRSLPLQTTEGGALWITVLVEDRLLLPSLELSFASIDHNLRINLDENVRDYLADRVTASDLAAAKDPRTGEAVLPKADRAQAVVDAVKQLLDQAPTQPSPLLAAAAVGGPLNVVLVPDVSAQWLPRHPNAMAIRSVRDSGASWNLVLKNGQLTYSKLAPTEAAALMTKMVAAAAVAHGIAPMAWYNPLDWPGYIADAAEAAFTFVVNGVKATLTILIDGIDYLYNFVLDTVDHVFDAINWVLDQAGVLLGAALGWLLKLLGFLFDWDAIKAKRDDIRDAVRGRAVAAAKTLSGPIASLRAFGATIDSVQATIVAGLTSFRSKPLDREAFGAFNGGAVSIPSLFSIGDVSVMPQATWLFEKLESYFLRFRFTPGLPSVTDLESIIGQLGVKLYAVAQSFAPSLEDFNTLVNGWFKDAKLFSRETLDPLIDILIRRIQALFDAFKAIVAAVADAIAALSANGGALIDWFDTAVPAGFFGGFYRGVTGRAFSMFDLGCLAAAIPASLGLTPTASRAMAHSPASAFAAGKPDLLRSYAFAFAVAGCLTTGIAGGFTAALPRPPNEIADVDKKTGYLLTGLDLVMQLGGTLCYVGDNDPEWELIATVGAVVALVLSAGGGYRYIQTRVPEAQRAGKTDIVLTGIQAILALINFGRTFTKGSNPDNGAVVKGLTAIQHLANVAMRLERPLQPPIVAPIAFGAFQSGLGVLKLPFLF